MPISRGEFESDEVDLVLEFFRSNANYAYTLEELVEERGRIESKTKRGVVYYIYCKPKLGFRT